jgi:RNA polymerase sigma-70 factor (ECF subfamily)
MERDWARAQVIQAAAAMAARARRLGGSALQRVELLRLRFHDNLEIRAIADQWQVEPTWLHHQFAKARREFRNELLGVLAEHRPGATPEELELECRDLLHLLE